MRFVAFSFVSFLLPPWPPSPKSMMRIAYSPHLKNVNFPLFLQNLKISPYFRSICFLPNLRFSASPYIDHDASCFTLTGRPLLPVYILLT